MTPPGRDRRLRVVVVGRPYDLSDVRYDGFVDRRRPLVAALAQHHELAVALLRQPQDRASVTAALREHVICDEPLAVPVESRLTRIGYLLGLLAGRDPWAADLGSVPAAVAAARPDVVVTLGPWLDDVFTPLFARFPAIHLFEEDLTRMHEIAPQSGRARAFRRISTFVRARRLAQPRAAVVISDVELPVIRRRYPAAQPVALPFGLPAGAWPLASGPSDGDVVLVVGTLTQARHAEGLAEALAQLSIRRPPGLRVRLISGAGLHPSLDPYRGLDWVEVPGHVGDLGPEYRAARLALVPAKRATGMKSTILQAWACGCPVVTYAGSAATLGAYADAMLVAPDGAGIARHIAAVWEDPALRARLAGAGRTVMQTTFHPDRMVDGFLHLVDDTAARG